jgi:hypothetical protein
MCERGRPGLQYVGPGVRTPTARGDDPGDRDAGPFALTCDVENFQPAKEPGVPGEVLAEYARLGRSLPSGRCATRLGGSLP